MLEGLRPNELSDYYSVVVVLWEMLHGEQDIFIIVYLYLRPSIYSFCLSDTMFWINFNNKNGNILGENDRFISW